MSMDKKRSLTAADIMPMAEYGKIRKDKRREMSERKRFRTSRGRSFCDLLFREFRHDVDAGA